MVEKKDFYFFIYFPAKGKPLQKSWYKLEYYIIISKDDMI